MEFFVFTIAYLSANFLAFLILYAVGRRRGRLDAIESLEAVGASMHAVELRRSFGFRYP